jgi:hypothetical protein
MSSNKNLKDEIQAELENIKYMGLGAQTDAHTGYASALASLYVAESLQSLQTQMEKSTNINVETLKENTLTVIESNEKLSKSNDRHSTVMSYLTGALVFVGFVQILVSVWASVAGRGL